jgi:UDP-glucose 4-epimerase
VILRSSRAESRRTSRPTRKGPGVTRRKASAIRRHVASENSSGKRPRISYDPKTASEEAESLVTDRPIARRFEWGARDYLSGLGYPPITRVGITGSSGQIGSALRARLAQDYEVAGFDIRKAPGSRKLDVASTRASHVLRGFDVLCHLAARISVQESIEDPSRATRTNVLGTVQVFEAARQSDARVIFFSSAAVYGTPVDVPIGEDHPLQPLSPYGLTKVVGENYARLYHALYGLNVTVVRPFNVYSERLAGNDPYAGVIRLFIENAIRKKPLIVHGDGGQTRDFVHVSDVIQLVTLLLDGRGNGRTFNCGTGSVTRIEDLATWVHDRYDPTGRILHDAPRPGDIRDSCANIQRARGLGYRPTVELKTWISSFSPPRRR